MFADLPPVVVEQLVQARDAEVQKVIKRFNARAKENGLDDKQHKEIVAATTGLGVRDDVIQFVNAHKVCWLFGCRCC